MSQKSVYVAGLVFLMALLSGCGVITPEITYTPSGLAPEQSMSLQQAKSIIKQLSQSCSSESVNCASFPPNSPYSATSTRITGIRIVDDKLALDTVDHVAYQTFSLDKLKVSAGFFPTIPQSHDDPVLVLNGWQIFVPGDSANRYADAITVFKEEAPNPEKEAAFAKIAESYRNAAVKPVPGEDVRRYEIMAEDAINHKHFIDAINDYKAGLKIAPWWPQGHFNAAMVMGELHDYGEAIEQMKDYLALMPDAPNARAAQDQIYRWESEAKASPDSN